MKQDYKVIGFNFTPELNSQLQEICKDTKMNRSEVVRQLIQKAFVDKKTREIITRNSYWEKAKRKMEGDTSHNVHCVNEEKKDSPHHSDESTLMSVSEDHQLDYSLLEYYVKEGIDAALKTEEEPKAWDEFWNKIKELPEREMILGAIDGRLAEIQKEQKTNYSEGVENAIRIAREVWLS